MNNKSRNGITWHNFHYWCKRICYSTGNRHKYKSIFSNSIQEDVFLPAEEELDQDQVVMTISAAGGNSMSTI